MHLDADATVSGKGGGDALGSITIMSPAVPLLYIQRSLQEYSWQTQ